MGHDREWINKYVTEMTEESQDDHIDYVGEKKGNLLLKQDRNKHQYRRLLLQRLRFHIISVFEVEPGPHDKICFDVSNKMIRLLRHDPSVLREEDGAAEFRISAQMFRSEFTSSQHWSIRAWLNYLQRGGPKKRFQYCVDPHSADTIENLRAIQLHFGRKHIHPT